MDALRDVIKVTDDKAGFLILEGHLSHLLDVELVVVLRCHPVELATRLEEKGFSPTKTRENIEAETVDVVLLDAVDIHGEETVFEVDTTALEPANTVNEVMGIIEDKRDARGTHRPGGVDWLAEGGDWL
jgi:adenylate kinase